jgi:hypothetical protein
MLFVCHLTRLERFMQHSTPLHGFIHTKHICSRYSWWLRMNPGLILMQDGAPGHIAKETQVDLKNAGSILYFAPHFHLI